jgi:DNA-binding transcriptional MerR regulator
MYSIGRFASIGRVSVRMLRHYDEIGLLVPAHVDPSNGYRSYAPEQLARLADVMRLRGLGLGLAEITSVLRAGDGDPAARVLLLSARDELRRTIAADTDRLARFDAYLRRTEGALVSDDTSIAVNYSSVRAARIATLTRRAPAFGPEAIGPVVGPMFPEAQALLDAAGVAVRAGIAIYTSDDSGDGSGAIVTAGFLIDEDITDVAGLDVHTLPALSEAAVATHRGPVDGIADSWMALADAVRSRGYVPSDTAREVYLTPADRPQSEWVTELVQPIERAG